MSILNIYYFVGIIFITSVIVNDRFKKIVISVGKGILGRSV